MHELPAVKVLLRSASLEIETPHFVRKIETRHEVRKSADLTSLALDPRWPLLVGRYVDVDLFVTSRMASRIHCKFFCEGTCWNVMDMRSTHGTTVNGRRTRIAPLQDGDLVELGGEVRLRFLEETRTSWRCPPLEEAIGRAPDEEAPWQVYADWLQEQGVALGPWGGAEPPRFRWRHGLVEAATVVSGERSTVGGLAGLPGPPVAGTLRRLTVQVRQFWDGLSAQDWLAALERTLRQTGPWVSLRELVLQVDQVYEWEAALETVRPGIQSACPRLVALTLRSRDSARR